MYGAILGDIIGSVYEWDNIKTKDFPLLIPRSRFTDDSAMTVAVAEALLDAPGEGPGRPAGRGDPLHAEVGQAVSERRIRRPVL